MPDQSSGSKEKGLSARAHATWLCRLLLSIPILIAFAGSCLGQGAKVGEAAFLPGGRVLLDAHNCYPYHGLFSDRIERAIKTGLPLAIEQDLVWYTDKSTGKSWSIVAHNAPFSGSEPTLKSHFFERIRPIVESALRENKKNGWPLITLNLDFKTEEAEHLAAIWDLLGEYESWLCTAERSSESAKLSPLQVRPVLVLTGSSEAQQRVFHDDVLAGKPLRLFGAVRLREGSTSIDQRVPPADNYRRWWNNAWSVVEAAGQSQAGEWTGSEVERLKALVRCAHAQGLWIRFYTLNGHALTASRGWNESYNFGSEEAARLRWQAAVAAGVDFVATDQYEAFSSLRAKQEGK